MMFRSLLAMLVPLVSGCATMPPVVVSTAPPASTAPSPAPVSKPAAPLTARPSLSEADARFDALAKSHNYDEAALWFDANRDTLVPVIKYLGPVLMQVAAGVNAQADPGLAAAIKRLQPFDKRVVVGRNLIDAESALANGTRQLDRYHAIKWMATPPYQSVRARSLAAVIARVGPVIQKALAAYSGSAGSFRLAIEQRDWQAAVDQHVSSYVELNQAVSPSAQVRHELAAHWNERFVTELASAVGALKSKKGTDASTYAIERAHAVLQRYDAYPLVASAPLRAPAAIRLRAEIDTALLQARARELANAPAARSRQAIAADDLPRARKLMTVSADKLGAEDASLPDRLRRELATAEEKQSVPRLRTAKLALQPTAPGLEPTSLKPAAMMNSDAQPAGGPPSAPATPVATAPTGRSVENGVQALEAGGKHEVAKKSDELAQVQTNTLRYLASARWVDSD